MLDVRAERTAAGGSVVLLAGIIVTAALNYGLGLGLAWLLPQDQFGVVAVLLTVLLLATSVLAAGFPWELARTLARADGHTSATAPAFRAAVLGNVGLGAVLAVAFLAVQLGTGRLLPDAGVGPTVLAAAAIVLLALGSVLAGALQGIRRFAALGLTRVLEVVVKTGLALALVAALGLGVTGVATALLLGAAAAAAWAWWALGDRLPGLGPVAGARTFAAAVPMAVGTTGFGLLGTLDVLLLGVLGHGHGVTTAVVAIYQAAVILARAPFFLGSALSDAVFPFIAGGRTAADAHRWLMVALRWVPLALVPLQLVLFVAPGSVLGLVFPADYAAAAPLCRIITAGTAGLIVADMLLKALFARGLASAVAGRIPVAVAVQGAALVVLIPRFGATGAALAAAAGTWTAAALLAVVYLRHHRPGTLRPGTAARWSVALGVLVAFLLAAGSAPRPVDLLVVLAGLGGYAAVAVRLRVVPEADVVRARALLGGRRG
ncbi:lipopolysaccharide biosynthesis protein [Pseudonocardia asaccharolytica]|uniref:Polysaccharide biosynthesis protein C-terminal domain-containing protein n=1 Tax=Pseudonocardia asaccharolytica DSM 44247 = NBRC 16224 TaxID=1123024 RepID=A0A511D2F4_9PSEU|nr:oligosaccharide flippase family protein [Pseudonocardia asaccharolytica]GEL18867.1 hypothetical protein PA7_27040 [Pseudonocardia asaccharolytica DSM 44247 = NBRC 16224]